MAARGIASKPSERSARSCSRKPTSCSTRWIAEDYDAIRQELGDFLLEAVFLAQICDEAGRFSIADSIRAISEKLIRRHPHVFEADGSAPLTPRQVKEKWEDIKASERATEGAREKTLLSGVPRSLPSLLRAYELSTRAATVGFDWVKPGDVIDKIEEEVQELREAVANHGQRSREAEEELGDLFFALANLARKMGVEPEAALRAPTTSFNGDSRQSSDSSIGWADDEGLEPRRAGERVADGKATTKDTKKLRSTKEHEDTKHHENAEPAFTFSEQDASRHP